MQPPRGERHAYGAIDNGRKCNDSNNSGRTRKTLKQAGVTSEEAAKTPNELKLNERWLKMSVHAGVVATQDGRYYLISKNEKQH